MVLLMCLQSESLCWTSGASPAVSAGCSWVVEPSEALQEKELRADTQHLALSTPFISSCKICSLVLVLLVLVHVLEEHRLVLTVFS